VEEMTSSDDVALRNKFRVLLREIDPDSAGRSLADQFARRLADFTKTWATSTDRANAEELEIMEWLRSSTDQPNASGQRRGTSGGRAARPGSFADRISRILAHLKSEKDIPWAAVEREIEKASGGVSIDRRRLARIGVRGAMEQPTDLGHHQ